MADEQTPWYASLDDAHKTTISAKGWDKLDPATAAATLAKSYMGLQSLHGGIAAGEYVKPPAPTDPAEVQAAFWQKLGTPSSPEGYNFADLKKADGTALPQSYLDAVRAAAVATNMPAHMVNGFVSKMIPHLEAEQAQAAEAKQAATAQSVAALEAEWGPKLAANKFIAGRAMDTLKVDKATVAALEGALGYQGVMNHFLALGEMLKEARFVPGGDGQLGAGALTPDQARDKLKALANDPQWAKRWREGGVEEATTKTNLLKIIAGIK